MSDKYCCEELRAWYLELLVDKPKTRPRDAAAALGVSEAELVACGAGAESFRLTDTWSEIMQALKTVGSVMCLTRNESVVHERHGCFEEVTSEHGIGLVLGKDIDLRLFYKQWCFGYSVSQKLSSGQRESLQFFDKCGDAVFKVYLTENTDKSAWDALVTRFINHETSACSHVLNELEAPTPAKAEVPDSEIDRRGFTEGWLALKDTHDFFILMRKFKVGRQQALRLGGPGLACELHGNAASDLLSLASSNNVPIMAFVGNRGCIQIHSGPVNKVAPLRDWINVLDPHFNLHLKESDVASVWWVRKPTEDGDVHSVEVFDSSGEMIVQFFGARKPGIPEREDWRGLLQELQVLGQAA